MYWRLLDAVGISLVIGSFIGAEAAATTASEYHPLADGNSEACSVDGTPILAHVVARGPH
jgi:hypothetical protein